jgi:ABC-type dipeptide/oligopeptide/nickel transport system permease component
MLDFLTRRPLTILIVSLVIVYMAFLGMNLIAQTDIVTGETELALIDSVKMAGEQTASFISGLLQGDLGKAPTTTTIERPVTEILWVSYKNSVALLLIAVTAGSLIGVVLGIITGLNIRTQRGYGVLMFTIAGVSLPSFLLAILLQQAGITYTINVGRHLVSMGGYGWDFKHLAMPLLVLTAWPVAYITRATYVSMGRIMEDDYIRTARAKGLYRRQVVLVHAMRNLAIPIITAVVVSFRFSLSIIPVVEFIFAWPGMGLRILEAIYNRVPILVASFALLIGLTIQLLGYLADLSYRLVDPRLREDNG